MGTGVDQTGPQAEISAQGTISWKVVLSNRRVLMLLIVLVGTMIGIAPAKLVAVLKATAGWL
tara:strand:- start:15 stop:200 length:186 start_codon:yes stop_codon:yes gene_type:complete